MEALERVEELLTGLVLRAERSTQTRCPYKDASDHCTASFGCRNQRRGESTTRPRCAGSDLLDYRAAWLTEPTEQTEPTA